MYNKCTIEAKKYRLKIADKIFKSLRILKFTHSQKLTKAHKKYGGEGGIRTHVGLHPNGFQDRPVMTASVPLQKW